MPVRQPLPSVPLGTTGRHVTRVGLGGEGVLRSRGRAPEATAVIQAALDGGLGYFDSARVYDDSELYYGEVWGAEPSRRAEVFQTSKSAERDGPAARKQLEETLKRLQTDHLDLWQLHDVRSFEELDRMSAPGGAVEAFIAAKAEGLVRHIGVTGHHDPAILTRAVELWPLDTVLLPVNPMEGLLGGFLSETLPAARARGMGIIGMKALGGAGGWGGAGGGRLVQAGFEAEALLAFALAQAVDVLIVGCATPAEVETLARLAAAPPMDAERQATLLAAMRPVAGRLASYRGVLGPPC